MFWWMYCRIILISGYYKLSGRIQYAGRISVAFLLHIFGWVLMRHKGVVFSLEYVYFDARRSDLCYCCFLLFKFQRVYMHFPYVSTQCQQNFLVWGVFLRIANITWTSFAFPLLENSLLKWFAPSRYMWIHIRTKIEKPWSDRLHNSTDLRRNFKMSEYNSRSLVYI